MAWRESISCEQKYTRHIQATRLALSSRQFCHCLNCLSLNCLTGAVVVAQRIGGDGPQAFLLLLSMRCTPTVRLLIVLTFATKLSLSSLDRLPASRLLLPRSGLERSDFVLWHLSEVNGGGDDVRSSG